MLVAPAESAPLDPRVPAHACLVFPLPCVACGPCFSLPRAGRGVTPARGDACVNAHGYMEPCARGMPRREGRSPARRTDAGARDVAGRRSRSGDPPSIGPGRAHASGADRCDRRTRSGAEPDTGRGRRGCAGCPSRSGADSAAPREPGIARMRRTECVRRTGRAFPAGAARCASPGCAGPGQPIDRCHGRVRSRRRARHFPKLDHPDLGGYPQGHTHSARAYKPERNR